MGADEKLLRARSHGQEVHRLVQTYLSGLGPRAVDVTVVDGGWREYRSVPLPSPDIEIAMVLGDFLQNARAALDHLIYDISTAVNPEFERTAFPVVIDPTRWDGCGIHAKPITRSTAIRSPVPRVSDHPTVRLSRG